MKLSWFKIISIFFIVVGICLLIFVLRLVWFPPSSMGMMMGKNMMIHHVIFMFTELFLVSLIFMGVVGTIWIFKNKGK